MYEGELGPTSDQLIELAADKGFEVSDYQLERWRRVGLIPRPRQIGLGRGRGSIVVHPHGTAKQLLALLRFKELDRRFTAIGWRLWGDGFPVTDFVREHTEPLLREAIQKLEGYVTRFDLEDDEPLSKTPPGYGFVSRKIGRGGLPFLFRAMADAFSGTFTGEWINAEDDADLIRKFYSGERSEQFTDQEVVQGFRATHRWIAEEASLPRILEVLEETSDENLKQIRDEARAALSVYFTVLREPLPPLPPVLFALWFWARKVSPTVMNIVNPMVAQPDWLDRVRGFAEQAREVEDD